MKERDKMVEFERSKYSEVLVPFKKIHYWRTSAKKDKIE